MFAAAYFNSKYKEGKLSVHKNKENRLQYPCDEILCQLKRVNRIDKRDI